MQNNTVDESSKKKREKRVNVRFDDAEFSQVEAAAGGKDVSTWVRNQALAVTSQPLAARIDSVESALKQVILVTQQQAAASALLSSDVERLGLKTDALVVQSNSFFQSPAPRVSALQTQISSLAESLKGAHKLHAQQLSNILAKLS